MAKVTFTKDGAKKLIDAPTKDLVEKLELQGWKQATVKTAKPKMKLKTQ